MKQKSFTHKVASIAIAFFIFLMYASPAMSDRTTGPVEAKNHFMWAVGAGQAKVYLLGSIHILKPEFYPLPDEIEAAYTKSRQIVFEADLNEMNTPSMQQKILTLGLYPGEDTLMNNLSPPMREKLQKKITQIGLPVSYINKFRPWFCAVTLTVMEFQRLGFDPNLGIDQHFYRKAETDHKKRLFLETVDFQFNLMSGLSANDQERMLGQTLKDLEVMGSHITDMETAWKSGDDMKLHTILAQAFKEYPEIYNKFIISRNKNWVPKIINIINQRQDTMIVVGAAHLVGPDSVLMMLKRKGYDIRQVSSAIN